MSVPGTHHTALYQTDFIRATKKRVTASQPTPPVKPPPWVEETHSQGMLLTDPSPGATRDVSWWPRWHLSGHREAKEANALPPRCSSGRVFPCGVPGVSCLPCSKVTVTELPPHCSPFPTALAGTAAPVGLAPRSLSLGSKREAAEHADRDKRMEQETRQHHMGTLARLRGRLLLPCCFPRPASVTPAPAIRRAPAHSRGPARPRGASRTRRRMEKEVITQGEVHCLRGVQLRAPQPRL